MKKIILKITATIFTILGMFIIWFIYVTEFKVTYVSQHVNPINNYTILFQEVGEPEWPFGKTHVKITLLNDKKKKVEKIPTYIQNDGSVTGEENILVEWFEDYAEVTLLGSEQEDEVHKIYYN